jgi:hypothetical protein
MAFEANNAGEVSQRAAYLWLTIGRILDRSLGPTPLTEFTVASAFDFIFGLIRVL